MNKKQNEYLDDFYGKIKNIGLKEGYTVKEVVDDIFEITPSNISTSTVFSFLAITHGDEVAGIGVFIKFLHLLLQGDISLQGKIYLILGNKVAYLEGKRFVKSDLNRNYNIVSSSEWEKQRAKDIANILNESDVSVDLHQTIEPTATPFFIIPDKGSAYKFICELGMGLPIIFNPIKEEPTTSSSYMAHTGKIGITAEIGDYGMNDSDIEVGLSILLKVMRSECETYSFISNNNLCLDIVYHKENNNDYVEFNEDVQSLTYVNKDDKIGKINGQDLLVDESGYVLLYPQKMINGPHRCPCIYIICHRIAKYK